VRQTRRFGWGFIADRILFTLDKGIAIFSALPIHQHAGVVFVSGLARWDEEPDCVRARAAP